MLNFETKGDLSNHFNSQLRSIMEMGANETFIILNFSLPGNQRYPYVDKSFLELEMKETLNKFYPLGARLVYIRPSHNDDHFIEVGTLVKFIC